MTPWNYPILLLAGVLISCGGSEVVSETMEEPEPETSICLEPAPPFARVDDKVDTVVLGACGHVAYSREGALRVLNPDLTEDFLAENVESGDASFSTTGHLLMWREADKLTIRDLRDGQEHIETGILAGGLVASDDDEGAWAWACREDGLGFIRAGTGFRSIDSEAACGPGTIRVPPAGHTLVYSVANQLRALAPDDTQPVILAVEYQVEHTNNIKISNDGRLVIHERLGEACDSCPVLVEEASVLDTKSGQKLLSEVEALNFVDAKSPGYPIIIRSASGPGAVFRENLSIEPLNPQLTPMLTLQDRSHVLYHDDTQIGVLNLASGVPETWIESSEPIRSSLVPVEISRDGLTMVAGLPTDSCIEQDDFGCIARAFELLLARGGTQRRISFFDTMHGMTVSDHGTVLTAQRRVTPPDVFEWGIYLFAEDGSVIKSWSADKSAQISLIHNDGQRALAIFNLDGALSLVLVDLANGAFETLHNDFEADTALHNKLVADAPLDRAVFLDNHTLYAGTLPNDAS